MMHIPTDHGHVIRSAVLISDNDDLIHGMMEANHRHSEGGIEEVLPRVSESLTATDPSSIVQSLGEPIVDMRRLWDCADNDREELQWLVGNYLAETKSQLEKIGKSISEGTFAEMTRYAHCSCGASTTFGFRAIAIPLEAIERIGSKNKVDGAEIQLAEAWRQLELLFEFLKAHPETAFSDSSKINEKRENNSYH